MSMISLGAIFSRTPLKEADLAEIDRVLAARTSNLVRTRKGRVWEFINGSVVLDVRGESVQSVLWDRESDLLSLGLLPDPGCFRVSITAGYRSDEIDRGSVNFVSRLRQRPEASVLDLATALCPRTLSDFFPDRYNPHQAGASNCRNFEKLANSMLDIEKDTRRIPPVRDLGFVPPELFTRHHTTQWLRPLSSPHRVIAVVPQGLCSVCMLRRPACVMDFPV